MKSNIKLWPKHKTAKVTATENLKTCAVMQVKWKITLRLRSRAECEMPAQNIVPEAGPPPFDVIFPGVVPRVVLLKVHPYYAQKKYGFNEKKVQF